MKNTNEKNLCYLGSGVIITAAIIIVATLVTIGSNIYDWNEYFKQYSALITGIARLATVMSALIAASGLWFTGRQIGRNTKQSQAKAIYDIQKDARAIGDRMSGDPAMVAAFFGREFKDEEIKIRQVIGQTINFYASAYQQKRLEILDDRLWQPLENDIVWFFTTTPQSELAKKFLTNKSNMYDSGFVQLVFDLCKNQEKSEKKPDPGARPAS